VRNVGFGVNVDQLRERFQDHGEIVEVVLPPSKRSSPESADGRRMKIPPHAGYAFVEFDTREQAQAAITAVNGNRISGRPVAVDFAYDARLYKAIQVKAAQGKPQKPVSKPVESPPVVEQKDASPQTSKRTQPSQDCAEVKPSKKQKVAASGGKPKVVSTEPESERKLFLVNVPFDAERSDVVSSVATFGKVEESEVETVLFVKDKETAKPTGKCFIVFSSVSACEKVLSMEKSAIPEIFGDLYKKDKRPVAPLEGAGCVILGRRVSIMKPLTKEELEKQKREKEEDNMPKNPKVLNRKHIDYVNAGWINENHEDIWHELSPKDQKMRIACNDEKKFKLNNPNFVINTKRLTVRNVPKRMENGDLQTAIVRAMGIKGSKKTKQAGILKVAIVKDKLTVAVGDRKPKEAEFDMNAPESDNEEKKESKEAVETKEKKRSRGFAFVDFKDSERALKCLQAMNNVPGAFGETDPKRRPIVEFSFDDVRKLQIQQQRAFKQSKVRTDAKIISKPPMDKKKLSRGQKQREKRRAQREAAPTNTSQ